jgi:hypothetical protein
MVHAAAAAAAAADGFIQVRTLHKELVLKTFHAQVGVELKEYELEKLKKKSNSKVALRPMLKVVAGKRGKPDSKKKKKNLISILTLPRFPYGRKSRLTRPAPKSEVSMVLVS